MPNRPPTPCTTPGCTNPTTQRGRCDNCRTRRTRAKTQLQGTARSRGYDEQWQRQRLAYLTEHPRCALCARAATIADHHPISRRELIAAGVHDPDADHRLRPLCDPCHRTETAHNQPGGWHRERRNA